MILYDNSSKPQSIVEEPLVFKMRKVLIFTSKMGHLSLAQAVEESFAQAGWQTKVHLSEFKSFFWYKPIYLFWPALFKFCFKVTQKKRVINIFRLIGRYSNDSEKIGLISVFKPDLVVSTHLLHNAGLERLKEEFGYKFINLVADPRTFHPVQISPLADLNLFYDEQAREMAIKLGLNEKKAVAVGWMTRKSFYSAFARETKKADSLRILFCEGTWGRFQMSKLLPAFLKIPAKIKLTLISGENQALYSLFRGYKKGIDKRLLKPSGELEVECYRYRADLDQLMARSDLVVGKAGPNLLFEAVAAGKPFMVISHVHGQENGNLEIIRQKKLGWVVEEPKVAGQFLKKIALNPKLLGQCRASVVKEREKNIKAGKRIVELAGKLISS